MFGLDFLFLAATLGLPLVGLPVMLHLLHRRKSTIVLFSTTRFIQASIQQTAARKKLQKWLLLLIRMLLLLMLILLAAQPVKRLAATFGGESAVAAIVVDTSYSMQTRSDENQSLIQNADWIITSLLKNELSAAKVSVFRSDSDEASELLQPAAKQLADWQPDRKERASKPLIERIESAQKMLENQQASSKWLIVISDSQAREFPRVLAAWNEAQVVFFDLHPESARNSGIVDISVDPYPPLPGMSQEAVLKLTQNNDQSRAITLEVAALDGKVLSTSSPRMISAAQRGESEIRIPFSMPAEPFVKMTARIEGDDDLAIDNTREYVIQSLGKQSVRLLHPSGQSGRFISLAIDPAEGRSRDWPLVLKSGGTIQNDDHVVVEIYNDWPSIEQASRIRQFVDQGNKAILFIRPGLETKWNALPEPQKQAILQILPASPVEMKTTARSFNIAATSDSRAFLKELADDRFQIGAASVSRFVPIDNSSSASILLSVSSTSNTANQGLLYKQMVGRGVIYTFTTLPDSQFSSLASHPLFLPMMVKACLPETSAMEAQNGIVSELLKININALQNPFVITPSGEKFVSVKNRAGNYEFSRTSQPGIYLWKSAADQTIGVSTLQMPGEESNLTYRPADTIVTGDRVTIVRSLEAFQERIATITQPQPRWSIAIGLLLVLLCAETLLGNHSGIWKQSGKK